MPSPATFGRRPPACAAERKRRRSPRARRGSPRLQPWDEAPSLVLSSRASATDPVLRETERESRDLALVGVGGDGLGWRRPSGLADGAPFPTNQSGCHTLCGLCKGWERKSWMLSSGSSAPTSICGHSLGFRSVIDAFPPFGKTGGWPTQAVFAWETWGQGNLGTDGTFPIFPIYATKGKLSWRQAGDGFFGRPPGRGARRRRVECSSLARKSGVPRGRPVKVQRRS